MATDLRRRDLLALIASIAALPLAARAQQKAVPVVGILAPNPKVFATLNVERDLAALGWQAERNLRLVVRASAGTNETLPVLAAELIAQNVDLIFAAGDHAVIAAQRASAKTPIVGVCDDMVGSHLVESMARPGGNTTGVSILASELDVKRLQLLHELVPRAARIGILADPTTISTRPQLKAAALALRLELITAQAANPDEIGAALDHLAGAGLGAVNVLASPILDNARAVIIDRLNRLRLPAIYQWPELAELGGLAGYGPRLARVIREAMQIVDKILRGARPIDTPVQQPTKFELVVNMKAWSCSARRTSASRWTWKAAISLCSAAAITCISATPFAWGRWRCTASLASSNSRCAAAMVSRKSASLAPRASARAWSGRIRSFSAPSPQTPGRARCGRVPRAVPR